MSDDERETECPECGGYGEVRHPNWGARSCPAESMTCPRCQGSGS